MCHLIFQLAAEDQHAPGRMAQRIDYPGTLESYVSKVQRHLKPMKSKPHSFHRVAGEKETVGGHPCPEERVRLDNEVKESVVPKV